MKRLHFAIVVVLVTLGSISCSSVQGRGTTPAILTSSSNAQTQPTETLPTVQESEYTLIGGACNSENCLFSTQAEGDFLIGVATVSAYYIQLERTAFDQTKICDSFIITDGPPALIQSLLSLIEQGNTVYTKNGLGQPIISLDLSTLTESQTQRLTSSSASDLVSIILLATNPTHRGAPVCFSHFEILRVK